MMRLWNVTLIALTFLASIWGTYLTRSGIVSSQHAFASGPVGDWFLGLLFASIFIPLFWIVYRSGELRAVNRIESLCSREAIFVLNNMILVALGVIIAGLTYFPKFSFEWAGEAITLALPVYNLVTGPFFALLLLLTAIGPGMAWVRTGRRAIVRYFLPAGLAAFPLAALLQWGAHSLHGGEGGEVPLWKQLVAAGGINWLGCFILTTLLFELYRTARLRASSRAEGFGIALFAVVGKDNRRWGGYLVHAGIALLAIAIVNSSVFQVHVQRKVAVGESFPLGDYEVTAAALHEDPDYDVYAWKQLEILVKQGESVVACLKPELRYYRKKEQTTREVRIHRGLLEDVYVFFDRAEREGLYDLSIYRNPYMNAGWLGWIAMVLGGVWAALPMGRRRVGLAE